MYLRLELHNHTTESDSSLTVESLIDFMEKDKVDAFALTDHNTISGHEKTSKLLKDKNSSIECIYGMEYTTYYGHILCFNLTEYVPFENINKQKPELLFHAIKEKDGIAGIAHPFSYGHPFARGCRFDMSITDFTSFDFVEIFNNPEPLYEVNEKGLLWWEELILKGFRPAATCGMDLHGTMSMENHYATYILKEEGIPISENLRNSIKKGQTHISKGPLLIADDFICDNKLKLRLFDTNKSGYTFSLSKNYLITLKSNLGITTLPLNGEDNITLPYSCFDMNGGTIIKLYENNTDVSNLIAIAPVIWFPIS